MYEIGAPEMDRKWGWISMIDRLSNGDITKHDQIYERNLIECLNLLGYWHDRDEYYEQVNKRMELKYKNKR